MITRYKSPLMLRKVNFRGFAEEETTVAVARYAPLNAISFTVGGFPMWSTRCIDTILLGRSDRIELGMRGFTAYAETISVYGTEDVFTDGDDTPWLKDSSHQLMHLVVFKCAYLWYQVLKYKWAKQKVNLCCTLKSVAYTSQKALMYKVSKNGSVKLYRYSSSCAFWYPCCISRNLVAAMLLT